jgi:hypothetical protein
LNLFIGGSALIVIAQTWKLIRTLHQKGKTYKQCYKEDPNGFWNDFGANIGGSLYLGGTFVFQEASYNEELS